MAFNYDLDAIGTRVSCASLSARGASRWRYAELLPLVPRGLAEVEPPTPLVSLPGAAKHLGIASLEAKMEGHHPTGSFKDRGVQLAVAAGTLGDARGFVIASTGNAGAALAHFAREAGREAEVILPVATADAVMRRITELGASARTVEGGLAACAREAERVSRFRTMWRNLTPFAEPYQLEGAKTIGLELVDQLGWRVPDFIFCPVTFGTAFLGIFKALSEVRALGWHQGRLPRMIACLVPVPRGRTPRDAPSWAHRIQESLAMRRRQRRAIGHALAVTHGVAMRLPGPSRGDLAVQARAFGRGDMGSRLLSAVAGARHDGLLSPSDSVLLIATDGIAAEVALR